MSSFSTLSARRSVHRCASWLVVLLFTVFLGLAEDKTRVFISNSTSWEISGGFGGGPEAAGGSIRGGARPQTAEVMKTFRKRCHSVIVTLEKENADYVVLFDHEGGKQLMFRKDNKIAVFNRDGDLVHAGSTRSLGKAVKNACTAIVQESHRR
jgi:hypothetical protein